MAKHNYPSARKPTGPRPTAGRKAKLLSPKRVTIWLEAEQIEWLNSQGDKSEIIRNLINRERSISNDLRNQSPTN